MNIQQAGYRLPVDDDFADLGTGPIPAAPYYDPAYFALEREAVFRRSWINIGHVSELPQPGSFIVRNYETLAASVLITRGKDDTIRAFHNVCTHRGTKLVGTDGGTGSRFTCPYHAWTFGSDGSLLAAPDFERFYMDKKDCGLPPIAVEVCAGLIFVNFAETPEQGLRDYLGHLADELEAMPVAKATHFSEWVYDIDVNWKLIWDNFQENYHVRFIHPKSGAPAVSGDNPYGYPLGYSFHGKHRKEYLWSNPEASVSAVRKVGFTKAHGFELAKGSYDNPHTREFFGIFPTFNIIGSPTGHFSMTVVPIAANRSRGSFRMYHSGEDQNASERFAREVSMIGLMDVHAEDTDVLIAGQIGLGSGALKHIHYQSQEVLCRHFFMQVDAAVEAYKAERSAQALLA